MEEAQTEKQRSGETGAHRQLKALGSLWLRRQGCSAVASEVRLPLSKFRVDVAGYRASGRAGRFGDTFALECKQSRADFLRDAGLEEVCLRERGKGRRELASLRSLLATHLPDCRLGRSLFQEYDEYDFSDLRHERWRRLVARLDLLERRLEDGVKLSRMTRYGVANYCYLLVAEGVLRSADELPAGWGCLLQTEAELRLIQPATRLASREETKLALLERIAARASREAGKPRVNRAAG